MLIVALDAFPAFSPRINLLILFLFMLLMFADRCYSSPFGGTKHDERPA